MKPIFNFGIDHLIKCCTILIWWTISNDTIRVFGTRTSNTAEDTRANLKFLTACFLVQSSLRLFLFLSLSRNSKYETVIWNVCPEILDTGISWYSYWDWLVPQLNITIGGLVDNWDSHKGHSLPLLIDHNANLPNQPRYGTGLERELVKEKMYRFIKSNVAIDPASHCTLPKFSY